MKWSNPQTLAFTVNSTDIPKCMIFTPYQIKPLCKIDRKDCTEWDKGDILFSMNPKTDETVCQVREGE